MRRGKRSPIELVEEALAAIDHWQPITNACSQVRAHDARVEAQVLEQAVARGDDVGPLAGVPVVVKDLFDVAGMETTGCCAGYQGRRALDDAVAVRRLREGGAVIVAKTNQHELAAGGTNDVSACGPTRNPWDPIRITGGSSGGSAAAVAAGIVPLALGTDTGGSIRIPASLCGTVGLKTTTGSLSLQGVMPLSPPLDTVGPLAMSVGDLLRGFEVIAGKTATPASVESLRGLRVGVLGGFYRERVADEVTAAVDAAAGELRDAGAEVVSIEAPGIEDAPHVWNTIVWSDAAELHGHLLDDPEAVLPMTRLILEFGRGVSPGDYEAARLRASEIRDRHLQGLAQANVLLAPTTPFPAPRADQPSVEVTPGDSLEVAGGCGWFTRPISLAGLPSIALPAGFSNEGLPLSVQIIGGPEREEDLLWVGIAFQERTDHHLAAPTGS
ncbi:MAG: amidase [Actinomycetota bacterium]